MNVLVTGSSGSTGRALVAALKQRDPSAAVFSDVVGEVIPDLSDSSVAKALVETVRPDRIYHCVGLFSGDFALDFQANVVASRQILDAVREASPACRVLLIGSAAEYGAVLPEANPIPEAHPLNPVSVYGLTKVFQTELMQYYHRAFDLHVVMARPFNLLGPGMSPRLFAGRLYAQIEELKRRERKTITFGSLSAVRDYLPLEEAVGHYVTIMERGNPGEVYNVGSGTPISMRELLRQVLAENGFDMSVVEEDTSSVKGRFDVPEIYADISRLKRLEPLR